MKLFKVESVFGNLKMATVTMDTTKFQNTPNFMKLHKNVN